MRKTLIATAVAAAMALNAFGALSAKYTDWAKGPVQFIMTKDEQAKWKTISNDADAQAFIDLFWARRDPTPNTPVNEFHDEFDAKVKYADEKFTEQKTIGSLTDRGKAFIILGPPTKVLKTSTEPTSTIQQAAPVIGSAPPPEDQQATTVQDYSAKQLWRYEAGVAQLPVDLPPQGAEIAFIDQYRSNQWKLERTSRTDYIALFDKVNNANIKSPSLTKAPDYAAPKAAAPAVAAAPAAPPAPAVGSFKTDAYRAAVEDVRAGKTPASKNAYVSAGEYITSTGQTFEPVQIYFPKSSGLDPAGEYTFFGMVEDANGKPAAIYEEPAKLTASKDDVYFDKSLTLTPGEYKATFGLAKAGAPVSIVTTPISVTAMEKDAPGISQLILSNDVHALPAAQMATDPFAFGGIKVVPKSDRQFHKADELWYFFEIRRPAAEADKAPAMKIALTMSGKTTEGKSVKMSAPESAVDVVPLKGVPGHFGVAQSIPLSGFKPGEYTLKVKVTDSTNNQTYNLEQPFTIATDK